MHHVDEGQGPTLLFLPPAPLWSFTYRRMIADLRADFRCVALDFPGFGPSPASNDFAVSLRAMSDCVFNFIRTLALREVTLVCHDSGGLVGLHAAGRCPENIRGVVIADGFGWPLTRFSPVRVMLRLISSPAFAAVQARYNLLLRLITTVGVRQFSELERRALLDAFPDVETPILRPIPTSSRRHHCGGRTFSHGRRTRGSPASWF